MLFLLFCCLFHRNETTSLLLLAPVVGWPETLDGGKIQENISVSRSPFKYILNRIGPFLARETVTEDPISPELWLALCLYRLGRGDYLYTIAEMAGVGVSTVCSIVNKVCQVLVDHPWSECVSSNTPKTQDDFKKKNVGYGRVLAISLLLGSNRRLLYPY